MMRLWAIDPSDTAARNAGNTFLDAWEEPHRRYHAPAHLIAVYDRLQSWADRADDLPLLLLTAFAHDAVYQGRPGDDERESAAMAEICGVSLGLSVARVDGMRRWILATAGHAPQPDNDGQLFMDADLEILASEPDAYDAYATAIREEYAAVPDDLFRSGRAAAMGGFLKRGVIYQHPRTPKFWETRARRNIAREIAALSSPR